MHLFFFFLTLNKNIRLIKCLYYAGTDPGFSGLFRTEGARQHTLMTVVYEMKPETFWHHWIPTTVTLPKELMLYSRKVKIRGHCRITPKLIFIITACLS